jgi:hypothetical protein
MLGGCQRFTKNASRTVNSRISAYRAACRAFLAIGVNAVRTRQFIESGRFKYQKAPATERDLAGAKS